MLMKDLIHVMQQRLDDYDSKFADTLGPLTVYFDVFEHQNNETGGVFHYKGYSPNCKFCLTDDGSVILTAAENFNGE